MTGGSKVPRFTADGVLPPSDYQLTFAELRMSHLVTGAGVGSPMWDEARRARLVDHLELLVRQLWQVGLGPVFINGSFVEDKDAPDDIDGYFECPEPYFSSGALERDLNQLDPYGVWDWSDAGRAWDPTKSKLQLPMWFRYRVELYPHFGQPTGVVDQFGNQLLFPALFRRTRAHDPKGVIEIVR